MLSAVASISTGGWRQSTVYALVVSVRARAALSAGEQITREGWEANLGGGSNLDGYQYALGHEEQRSPKQLSIYSYLISKGNVQIRIDDSVARAQKNDKNYQQRRGMDVWLHPAPTYRKLTEEEKWSEILCFRL